MIFLALFSSSIYVITIYMQMQLTNLYSPVNYLQLEVLLDIFVKNVPSAQKVLSSKMYWKSCKHW